MRSSMAILSAALAIGAIAACDSSTAPAECDSPTTTASFSNASAFTGVVTKIEYSSNRSSEIVTVRVPSDPPYEMKFTVDNSTAVFERDGSAVPNATSACRLAVGRSVEIPFAVIGDGFGDYIGLSQAGAPPAVVSQIVVDR